MPFTQSQDNCPSNTCNASDGKMSPSCTASSGRFTSSAKRSIFQKNFPDYFHRTQSHAQENNFPHQTIQLDDKKNLKCHQAVLRQAEDSHPAQNYIKRRLRGFSFSKIPSTRRFATELRVKQKSHIKDRHAPSGRFSSRKKAISIEVKHFH